jgi:hypothetical protein
MKSALMVAILTLASGYATTGATSTPSEAPTAAVPVQPAPPGCESFETCTLTCPEGATMDRDAANQLLACKTTDGVKEGPIVAWYPNGQMQLRGEKKAGKGHGAWTNWHDNGQKSAESVWDSDTWVSGTCWDTQGQVLDPKTCWPPPPAAGP